MSIYELRRDRDMDFDEVFAGWRQREASDPAWQDCATKVKGWPDWQSWREFTVDQLRLRERMWILVTLNEPGRFVPNFLMGPYTGWQKLVPESAGNSYTFQEMLSIPVNREHFECDPKVRGMMQNFPAPTQLIGVIRRQLSPELSPFLGTEFSITAPPLGPLHNLKIACIDGHHRATAITLAHMMGKPLQMSAMPTLALGMMLDGDEDLFDAALQRGTSYSAPK